MLQEFGIFRRTCAIIVIFILIFQALVIWECTLPANADHIEVINLILQNDDMRNAGCSIRCRFASRSRR